MQSFRLFIGNIPAGTTESELSEEFRAYGNVEAVELKSKADNIFAFVNIQTEDRIVGQCIHEFGEQKFKGVFLNVSRAKESFLDRLKREREETERKKSRHSDVSYPNNEEKQIVSKSNPATNLPTFTAVDPVESSSSSESSSESENDEPVPSRPPPRPQPVRNEDDFVRKWNCEGYLENGLLKIVPITGEVTEVINRNKKPTKNKTLDAQDEKRLKGLDNIKNTYESQKKQIQNALSASLDGGNHGNKKIKFDEDDLSEKKLTLFDDDDDEGNEDLVGYKHDFQVKKQFQGEKGEDLFNLQARFKSDSRFIMDSKFMEGDPTIKGKDKKKNSKKRTGVEKEIEAQMKLLQEMGCERKASQGGDAKQQKTMIRFDPNKQEHNKYVGRKGMEHELDGNKNEQDLNRQEYQVSNEQFVKVNKDLRKVLGQGTEGFSLLQMMGRDNQDDDEIKPQDDDEYTVGTATFKGKRFRHDSSDDSEPEEDPKSKKLKIEPKMSSDGKKNSGKYSKMGVFQENLFFSVDDERLKDGLKFFTQRADSKETDNIEDTRKNLKKIVKQKIKKQTLMKSRKDMYLKSFQKRDPNQKFGKRKGNKFQQK